MTIKKAFQDSIAVKQSIAETPTILNNLQAIARRFEQAFLAGKKILFCGNGGSAADAQHLVAELLVRLRASHQRSGLAALALAQDSSTMTACCNDYEYDFLYSRLVETLGQADDILVGISTSGSSPSITRALQTARKKNLTTVGFLGGDGGEALAQCDLAFVVPSNDTARIQEAHITAGHAIIETVEDALFARGFFAE